jgi:hypothetical protein
MRLELLRRRQHHGQRRRQSAATSPGKSPQPQPTPLHRPRHVSDTSPAKDTARAPFSYFADLDGVPHDRRKPRPRRLRTLSAAGQADDRPEAHAATALSHDRRRHPRREWPASRS